MNLLRYKMKFIFTCQENSKKLAVYELGLYDESFAFVCWLSNEVALCETSLDIASLAELIRRSPIIFVRHIFEVTEAFDVWGAWTHDIVELCHETLDFEGAFAVQTRSAPDAGVPIRGIADSIAEPLVSDGYTLDVKNPSQIVSVYITNDKVYAGVGTPDVNLSKFRGGMPRFAPTEEFDFISRAEYKLLDIIDCMKLDTDGMERALDLGAAPGGWTKALLGLGLKVTSVDPIKLDEKIYKNKNVSFKRMTAEKYLESGDATEFDIIVDDMKIDVEKTLGIVASFEKRLKPGGIAVITFKLPHSFAYKHLLENLHYLRNFELVGARQLFYNRSEITAVYRRKEILE